MVLLESQEQSVRDHAKVSQGSRIPPQALEKMSEKALVEFAPFAATLAQRLAKLVTAGQLAPGQPLWVLALDGFLLRACDTEGQVDFASLHPL